MSNEIEIIGNNICLQYFSNKNKMQSLFRLGDRRLIRYKSVEKELYLCFQLTRSSIKRIENISVKRKTLYLIESIF